LTQTDVSVGVRYPRHNCFDVLNFGFCNNEIQN